MTIVIYFDESSECILSIKPGNVFIKNTLCQVIEVSYFIYSEIAVWYSKVLDFHCKCFRVYREEPYLKLFRNRLNKRFSILFQFTKKKNTLAYKFAS